MGVNNTREGHVVVMQRGGGGSVPWLPATGAIVPIRPGDLPDEANLALRALAGRILSAPLGLFRPVERCGRVVAVAVEPTQAVYLPDPILPIPLVHLPGRFWNDYSRFCQTALWPWEKQPRLNKLVRRAWRQAERLVQMAAPHLNGPEAAYFQARLLASLAGEVEK